MFVGHYAIAFLLIILFPHVSVWVPLFGVAFPDLLWGILVLANREEVVVDKDDALQKSVIFKKYPYSHSAVLGGLISLAVGSALAVSFGDLSIIAVFVMASLSHWILDTVVHLHDLPVLGFDGDRKVGFGLWRWGVLAFFVELVLFSVAAILFVKSSALLPVLAVGLVFHAINANSFIGFNKKNLFGSSRTYAIGALVGFAAASAILSAIL